VFRTITEGDTKRTHTESTEEDEDLEDLTEMYNAMVSSPFSVNLEEEKPREEEVKFMCDPTVGSVRKGTPDLSLE